MKEKSPIKFLGNKSNFQLSVITLFQSENRSKDYYSDPNFKPPIFEWDTSCRYKALAGL